MSGRKKKAKEVYFVDMSTDYYDKQRDITEALRCVGDAPFRSLKLCWTFNTAREADKAFKRLRWGRTGHVVTSARPLNPFDD